MLVSFNTILVGLLVLFLAFVFVVSAGKLLGVAREGQEFKTRVMGVLSGPDAMYRKEDIMKELKRHGMGLRTKFTMLIGLLVVLVVLMLSIPLSYTMIQTQTQTLAEGLQARANVLLGSMSAGSEAGLLDQDANPLRDLTNQIAAMPEAQFAIITGITPNRSSNPGQGEEYVWASNDEDIGIKLTDKPTGDSAYDVGLSIIEDEVSPQVPELADRINKLAIAEVAGPEAELSEITSELVPLLSLNDEKSRIRRTELGVAQGVLERRINTILRGIASEVGSVPQFDFEDIRSDYIFYAPIVYRSTGQDIYFRGLVRVRISASSIIEEIARSRGELIRLIAIIATAAIALGIVGALILASITVSPIKKLAEGVTHIGETEDKAELENFHIDIKQKDEIRTLADTVNDMTKGLVKASAANKELIIGKDVQKKFIPLTEGSRGEKLSTGGEITEHVEIFGFYEGAKGVSGDYFDYIKLDPQHYAVIKCDIAGKGIPAALIMVEVATIFLIYFRGWTIKANGLKLDKLVYLINDLLEERGFIGRFAAFIVAIVNVETGLSIFCNAGDNIINIYEGSKRKMKKKEFPETPAAGVFPSMLVEMKSGYPQEIQKLKSGDTLFLYTDGVEEAKRTFRDPDYTTIKCHEEGLGEGAEHGGTHLVGSENEEFGIPRIDEVIDAVFKKGRYSIQKYHNPNAGEQLDFDFSTCEGSVEDAVLAIVAAEKVFRMYRPPTVGAGDTIVVDRAIEGFLQEHFVQYSLYFDHKIENENNQQAITFGHLKEDAQYDDLTILAIRKK